MGSIFDGLNAAQMAAVTSEADVVQILAPPGSGKTKTLTSRVAYLLERYQYKPWNIICLTFTIKSAREMRDRISKLIGNGTEKKIILGTFHSVCRRYLVSYGHLIGIRRGFGIADTSDTLSILKRVTKRYRLNIDPKKAQTRISHTKSKGLNVDDLLNQLRQKKNMEQQEIIRVFEEYEKQLSASNLLDYDDLLRRCVDLLREHPQCVSNVEAVLIDEFQDTNLVQFNLMTLFAAKNGRVSTVGDMNQSIYGWRSAEIENLDRMQTYFPDTLVIHLDENYRSSAAILSSANEVIGQDTSRLQKLMMPTHCPGTAPVLRRLPSAEIEASWIVTELRRSRALTGELLTFSDFAILLRSASLSRLIETALGKEGIPYRMVGGHRFYDRAEIKMLLDYLRVVSQPSNNDAIVRTINVPPRGIGDATIKLLLEQAELASSTLWTSLGEVRQGFKKPDVKVSKSATNGIGSFASVVISCRNRMLSTELPATPEDLLRLVIRKLSFKAYLEKSYPDDHETRWLNVDELVSQAADFRVMGQVDEGAGETAVDDALPRLDGLTQADGNAAEEALARFLANIALTTELQQENEADEEGAPQQHQVTISTIHAAKGLEWPVVFVPSAYDGCIPHSRAEDIDEERRLLYVAMTRAQALLYMSCPVRKAQREEATLSPFLSEKKVQHFFATQGPTIDTMAVNDIARILRRDCPREAEIVEASRDLDNSEDNKWSLDGAESIEVIQARLARWADGGTGRNRQRASKRRRLGHDEQLQPLQSHDVPNLGFTTTMQDSSAFSCNMKSGFMTASAHMQTLSSTMVFESQSSRDPTERKRLKKVSSKEEQPSLRKLWGAQANLTSSDTKFQYAATVRPQTAFQTIEPDSQSREPLLPIHQSLSTRRLPQPSGMGHPFSKTLTDCSRSSTYDVFLSSSPPPPDAIPRPPSQQGTTLEKPNQDARAIASDSSASASDIWVANGGIRGPTPAQGNASRKILGMRRSMAGWNSTSRPGFTIPKMNNVHR